jgi:hypothetical protein
MYPSSVKPSRTPVVVCLSSAGRRNAQQLQIAAMIEARTSRQVLGFLGSEYVILHERGFLMTTIGYGPHGPMLAFLTNLCRDTGCQVYSPEEGKIVTEEIIGWLTCHASD